MTTEQINLVKKSWRLFRHVDPQLVGGLFYGKLFTDHPYLRRLFKSSAAEQSVKLIDMLNTIVYHLDDLDGLTDEVRAMAGRHLQYGVKPGHYKVVGAALLWTLQQGLGVDWTKEVAEAWLACYTGLANRMMEVDEAI